MSRFLVNANGCTVNNQFDPTLPPDHVLLLRGQNVVVIDEEHFNPALPRVDYVRTYNVIPPNATEAQAVAIFLEGWRRGRETAGGSYDDAGHGALSNKTARLYGIAQDKRVEFINWYIDHYVGTKLIFADMPKG